jgi:nucleoside-diphosphate-sugar epimerase
MGFPYRSTVVTGGSGKVGRTVTRVLLEHGYELLNVDRLPPQEPLRLYLEADLAELG